MSIKGKYCNVVAQILLQYNGAKEPTSDMKYFVQRCSQQEGCLMDKFTPRVNELKAKNDVRDAWIDILDGHCSKESR